MHRGAEPKPQCLETFHRSQNRIHKALLLCQQQDTQCTGDIQSCRDGMPPCVTVIQHKQMVRRLQTPERGPLSPRFPGL